MTDRYPTNSRAPEVQMEESHKKATLSNSDSKELKRWQVSVLKYLFKICSMQTGAIIYHYMGTGKTFLATTAVANYARPFIIVAPLGLHAQWRDEYLNKYRTSLPKLIGIYTYESLWKYVASTSLDELQEYCIVFDESHNISIEIEKNTDIQHRHDLLAKIMSVGRRLLLTGTPLYWGARDLAYQVNVAAGKFLIPVDPRMFAKEYMYTDKLKSALFGWFKPSFDGITALAMRIRNNAAPVASASLLLFFLSNQDLVSQVMGQGQADQSALVAFILQVLYEISNAMELFLGAVANLSEIGLVMAFSKFWDYLLAFPLLQTLFSFALGQKDTIYSTSDVIKGGVFPETTTGILKTVTEVARPFAGDMVKIKDDIQKEKKIFTDTYLNADTSHNLVVKTWPHVHGVLHAASKRIGETPHPSGNIKDIMDLANDLSTAGAPILAAYGVPDLGVYTEITKDVLGMIEHRNKFKTAISGKASDEIVRVFTEVGSSKGGQWLSILLKQLTYQFTFFIIVVFMLMIAKLYTDPRQTQFMNMKKLGGAVSKYMSFYKPNGVANKKTTSSPKEDESFPTVIAQTVNVNYTKFQAEIFIRYTIGAMRFEDYLSLGLADKSDTVTQFSISVDQFDKDFYLNHGRMIGNACVLKRGNERVAYAQAINVHEDLTVSLAPGVEIQNPPAKFINIAEFIKKHRGRHLVYSNFGMASRTFCVILLKFFNIKSIFVPNNLPEDQMRDVKSRFNAQSDVAVLVLDTSYSEGFSLKSCNYFHIMDPTLTVAKDEQLRARVVRLDSHKVGESVTILQYFSTCGWILQHFESVMQWLAEANHTAYNISEAVHEQSFTPDQLIMKHRNEMDGLAQSLNHVLQKTSMDTVAEKPYTAPAECGQKVACTIKELGRAETDDSCAILQKQRRGTGLSAWRQEVLETGPRPFKSLVPDHVSSKHPFVPGHTSSISSTSSTSPTPSDLSETDDTSSSSSSPKRFSL